MTICPGAPRSALQIKKKIKKKGYPRGSRNAEDNARQWGDYLRSYAIKPALKPESLCFAALATLACSLI